MPSSNNAPKSTDELRSFGRRHGRKLREHPQQLVETLLPRLQLSAPVDGGRLDAKALQGDKRALWLEIGFGAGEHLLQLAQNHPDVMMIGGEPYMNGVSLLLKAIEKTKVENIHIVPDDIRPVMKALPDGSLERIYLLFPDPWPKRKQQKRRILNHAMLDEMARLIPAGGILQLATDHYDYSVWMLEHLHQRPEFTWQAESVHDWHEPPTHWVPTKYETKTRAEGRQPVYLRFIRKP